MDNFDVVKFLPMVALAIVALVWLTVKIRPGDTGGWFRRHSHGMAFGVFFAVFIILTGSATSHVKHDTVENVSLGCLPGTSGESCPVAAVDSSGNVAFITGGELVSVPKGEPRWGTMGTGVVTTGAQVSAEKVSSHSTLFYGVGDAAVQSVEYRITAPESRVSYAWDSQDGK